MDKDFEEEMMEEYKEEGQGESEELEETSDTVVVACDDDSAIDELKLRLEKEAARADEFLLTAKRLQAEFDNYRKRTNETNKRVREDGNADVLTELLPVLDAIGHAEKMISDQKTLEGIEIIKRQLSELLNRFGVQKIEALGKPFDPNVHNAIMQADTENEELRNCVVEVYQEGYMLNGRVLRHSVVIVGK